MTSNDESHSANELPPVVGDPLELPDTDKGPLPVPAAEAVDDQPRLGIIHIMLWTLGCAIVLAVSRALDNLEGLDEKDKLFHQILQIFHSILGGTGVGGLILFVARRFRGVRFPTQPGHWLLLIYGMVTTLSWTGWGIAQLIIDNEPQEWDTFDGYHLWYIFAIAIYLLAMGIYFYGIFHFKALTRWIVCFAMLGLASLFEAGVYALYLTEPLNFSPFFDWRTPEFTFLAIVTFTTIVLIVAVLLDLIKNNRRDWLHWTGVVVIFNSALLECTWRIWFWVSL